MLATLYRKELRETAPLAALGLLGYLYFVGQTMGLMPFSDGYERFMPFLRSEFPPGFALVSVGLTIALGLRQTAAESLRDTYLFLLHRPATWRRIFGVKLLAGLSLYLITAALPVLLLAGWAATPGSHAAPFYWSMTQWVWQVWTAMTVVYLGAFLAGLRPARWFGSRLWPIVTAGLLTALWANVPWSTLTLLGTLVSALLLLWLIFGIAHGRDYP